MEMISVKSMLKSKKFILFYVAILFVIIFSFVFFVGTGKAYKQKCVDVVNTIENATNKIKENFEKFDDVVLNCKNKVSNEKTDEFTKDADGNFFEDINIAYKGYMLLEFYNDINDDLELSLEIKEKVDNTNKTSRPAKYIDLYKETQNLYKEYLKLLDFIKLLPDDYDKANKEYKQLVDNIEKQLVVVNKYCD